MGASSGEREEEEYDSCGIEVKADESFDVKGGLMRMMILQLMKLLLLTLLLQYMLLLEVALLLVPAQRCQTTNLAVQPHRMEYCSDVVLVIAVIHNLAQTLL